MKIKILITLGISLFFAVATIGGSSYYHAEKRHEDRMETIQREKDRVTVLEAQLVEETEKYLQEKFDFSSIDILHLGVNEIEVRIEGTSYDEGYITYFLSRVLEVEEEKIYVKGDYS